VRKSRPAHGYEDLDPETAYKRLLLFGVIAGEGGLSTLGIHTTRDPRLAAWAKGAALQDPGSYFGVMGAYVVEASKDRPPTLEPGALGAVARAWVLSLPAELQRLLPSAQARRKRTAAW
jgi:hypothetical protein